MKRKGPNISEEREPKRIKLDRETTGELNLDAVREIFKYFDDLDIIRHSRVSKTWNKASRQERSRFIAQKITRSKLVLGYRLGKDPLELFDLVNTEINNLKCELDGLVKLQADLMKENRNSLSFIDRWSTWFESPKPKKAYTSFPSIAPEGDDGYYKGRTFDLDAVLDILVSNLQVSVTDLEEIDAERYERAKKILRGEIPDDQNHLNEEEDNEDEDDDDDLDLDHCADLYRLEKYLQVLMDLNFGSCVYDW